MKTALKSVSMAGVFIFAITTPVVMSGSGKSSIDPIAVAVKPAEVKKATVASEAVLLYDAMNLQKYGLPKSAFEYAFKGYSYLLQKGMVKNAMLSICDFSQSSRRKRLYVIDMDQQQVVINTYVAHGRRSGGEYARSFSNNPESHKSSLGFYITGNSYYGDHGLALKIAGLEKGINDKANARNIVIHGSEYVGPDFLKFNRFNGRSFGCPAVPADQTASIINSIKGGSCLFIYYPTPKYLTKSKILKS